MEGSSEYYLDKMIKLNVENSAAVILVAQEIMNAGQLWISLDGDEYYIPELIEQVQLLIELDNKNNQFI